MGRPSHKDFAEEFSIKIGPPGGRVTVSVPGGPWGLCPHHPGLPGRGGGAWETPALPPRPPLQCAGNRGSGLDSFDLEGSLGPRTGWGRRARPEQGQGPHSAGGSTSAVRTATLFGQEGRWPGHTWRGCTVSWTSGWRRGGGRQRGTEHSGSSTVLKLGFCGARVPVESSSPCSCGEGARGPGAEAEAPPRPDPAHTVTHLSLR